MYKMNNIPCEVVSYLSIRLFFNNGIQWQLTGDYSSDFILGISVALLALFPNITHLYLLSNKRESLTINELKDINKIGTYISYSNITTNDALKCYSDKDGNAVYDRTCMFGKSQCICDFRDLTPNDGTKALWIFDHNETDGPRWNLIMTDNISQFLLGFKLICDNYGVDYKNYILGQPLSSEGSVLINYYPDI